MRPRSIVLPVIALMMVSSAYGKQKKIQVAPLFQTAHSIYVECVDGDGMKPGVSPADHQAILQVEQAFHEWNRYTITDHREQADLVIVVRKGHAVGDQDHMGLGLHPQAPQPGVLLPGTQPQMQAQPRDQNASVGTGGDTIASEDTLRVFTVTDKGKLKGPIWSAEMDKGLDGPTVHLVKQLAAAVEITYPRESASGGTVQPAP